MNYVNITDLIQISTGYSEEGLNIYIVNIRIEKNKKREPGDPPSVFLRYTSICFKLNGLGKETGTDNVVQATRIEVHLE